MPTLFANTADGYVQASGASWTSARDATSGYASTTSSRLTFFVRVGAFPGRGGGSLYIVQRAFMHFNTSGVSVAPSEAILKIYGYSQSSADIFAVKSTHGTSVASGDFDAIAGWDNSGVDNSSNVTKYSDEIASWDTSDYNEITLNATARSDMASVDDFQICIMEADYDLPNNTPSVVTSVGIGAYTANWTGTDFDPKIDYTEGTATAVSHNATFFGTNF